MLKVRSSTEGYKLAYLLFWKQHPEAENTSMAALSCKNEKGVWWPEASDGTKSTARMSLFWCAEQENSIQLPLSAQELSRGVGGVPQ